MTKQPHTSKEHYDREIMPAETAARMEREGQTYKDTPQDRGGIDTDAGYTVDREGLANNFAVEPEMYVNEPGDLREKQEARSQARQEKIDRVNETNEDGKLTMEKDERSKGPGLF